MEDNNTIIFRMGEETGIVIEKTKEQFEHSLFREQYRQAFGIVNDIIVDSSVAWNEAPVSNIVAFCGDRGEGKTSVLMTVKQMLSSEEIYQTAQKTLAPIASLTINPNEFYALDIIDPSFFDEQHNILELVLGQLYEMVKREDDAKKTSSTVESGEYRPLMEKFAVAKKCLSALEPQESMYDAISELSTLAASMRLRKAIDELFAAFLAYYKKKKLIISIDDIDLNMKGAYVMTEDIRKYLSNNNCIILLAVKVDQLTTAIRAAIRRDIPNTRIVTDAQITDMAHKYVTKFIPESNQVVMPSPDDVAEKTITLLDRNNELVKDINNLPAKEIIVRLIFNKTRYLFYNSRSNSPIVPLNLRSMRHLISVLVEMPEIYEDDESRNEEKLSHNKNVFKNYFYHSWIGNLSREDREFALQLATYKDVISINKFVVSYLAQRINIDKDTKIDNIFNDIVTPENKSHNISVGDVYYVIKQIEAITTDVKIHLLLFFVRAFYSMRLYGLYDSITTESELQNNIIGRSGKTSKVRIYKYDSLYEGTNELQKFLNGSYFTYFPGSLINDMSDANDNTTIKCKNRDIRPINGKKLAKLLVDNTSYLKEKHLEYLRAKVAAKEKEDKDKVKESFQNIFTDEIKLSIQRCEYFILCTTHQLISDEAKKDRQSVNPPFIGVYDSIDKKYLYYDFLAIFYNIINIGYAFGRFGKVGKQFYRFVKKFPWTLTSQMTMLNAGDTWPNKAYKFDLVSRYHKLLSDGCVRVSEVQQSIIEELTKNKLSNKHKDNGKNAYKLKRAYEDIQKLEISLYPYSEEKDSYRIPFNFLTPIIEYLDKEEKCESNEFDDVYIVRADSIRNNPSTDNERREFFQRFPATKKSQAEKRESIINVLRKNQPNLPDSKSEFWNDIFPNKRYAKQEWINICIGAKDKITKYI